MSGQADRLLTDADITAGKVGYEFDRPATDGVMLTVTATTNVAGRRRDNRLARPTAVITEDEQTTAHHGRRGK